MIEQTRELVRSFNHAYQTDVLVEPEGIILKMRQMVVCPVLMEMQNV